MGQKMVNNDASRAERLQIMLSGDELMVLDDFRFRNRMPSRAAAIRELLKRGLAAEGFEAAAFGTKSEEFGVTGRTPAGANRGGRAHPGCCGVPAQTVRLVSYRTSSRIARSSPSSVSGNIRPPMSWRTTLTDCVKFHSFSGTGLSQTQAG